MSRSLLKRLIATAPSIEWSKPIPVRLLTGNPDRRAVGFLCRICVAQLGFKNGADNDRVFSTEGSCLQHIEDAHMGTD